MTVFRLLGSECRNVARSRWLLAYAIVLLGLTEFLFRFGGSGSRVVLSLTNVVLALVPLVSLIFGTLQVYHSREFIQLILAQPVSRRALFAALFGGLVLPLAGAFLLGAGLPFLWHGAAATGYAIMLGTGVLLTVVFTAGAFYLALRIQDRAVGLGAAIVLWLAAVVVYDGAILLGITLFSKWPLETPALIATLLNPVDLGRVLLLLQFDLSALSGYTGAVFERFFGGGTGAGVAAAALLAWAAIPFGLALRRFQRKDW
jgi:Cu-processing system permease protein